MLLKPLECEVHVSTHGLIEHQLPRLIQTPKTQPILRVRCLLLEGDECSPIVEAEPARVPRHNCTWGEWQMLIQASPKNPDSLRNN